MFVAFYQFISCLGAKIRFLIKKTLYINNIFLMDNVLWVFSELLFDESFDARRVYAKLNGFFSIGFGIGRPKTEFVEHSAIEV